MAAPETGAFELELFCPAKLSLFLRVSKRDDGFHDSASLYQTVDVGDRLRLARIPGDEVAAAGVVRPSRKSEPIKQNVEFSISPAGIADLPVDQTNMVVRALTLYRKKLTERDGGSFAVPRFRAHLVKELPIDAGLGGAASNAAAALVGANELCSGRASVDELRAWATELGTDVASFLAAGGGGAALCTGRAVFLRGDAVAAVRPLAPPPVGRLFIVAPQVSLSTPALFRARAAAAAADPGQRGGAPGGDAAGAAGHPADADAQQEALRALQAGAAEGGGPAQLPADASLFANDLQAAAEQCSPELAAVAARLREREGFGVVALSGAGPALFALGAPPCGEAADAFAARFARECAAEAGVRVRVWPAGFAEGPRVEATTLRGFR